MKLAAGLIAFGLTCAIGAGEVPKAKAKHSTAPPKTGTGKTNANRAVAGKAGSGVGSSRATTVRTKPGSRRGQKRVKRVVSGPSYQTHPDPARYRQIQQALADRGYFKGEVNGEWNDDSVDAIRRFQADQRLDTDGKISALTLRDLGLGPKHDGSTAPLSGATATAPVDLPPMPTEATTPPPE